MSDYVPKPDIEGINSSANDNRLKDAAILVGGFVAIVGMLYVLLIGLSDWAMTKISPEQEARWFGKIWTNASNDARPPADFEALTAKVNQQLPFKLNVGVLCTDEINALALPGGKIFLTRGLLENMKTENGLVFVLGHEVGHMMGRHHVRGLGRQVIFAAGAMLIGFSEAGSLSLIQQLLSRFYDRGQEIEADAYGLQLSQKIYGHTQGAEELFDILAKQESTIDQSLARVVSTHPPSADRRQMILSSQTKSQSQPVVRADAMNDWPAAFGCKP